MLNIRRTIIKNSAANTIRGVASTLVAVALPHFLVHSLDRDRFGGFVLLLQVAAYGNYLDFGLQATLARFFAQTYEGDDGGRRRTLVSSSIALLLVAAAIAILVVAGVAADAARIFPKLPLTLLPEFRASVMLLGTVTAIGLPLSAYSGVLLGMHRNDLVAFCVGISRLLGGGVVLLVAPRNHSLLVLSACIAGANLLGALAQLVIVRFLLPALRAGVDGVSTLLIRELLRFSSSLMVWSLAGFLVAGLDLTLVGHFQFQSVGFYSICSYFVAILIGINAAVCGALMTPIAALHAAGEIDRIRAVTLRVTRAINYVNLVLTVFALIFGHTVLRAWVGSSYADPAVPILDVLAVANTIRLIPSAYASMLIATGQQRHGVAQGVCEGVVNLVSSLILGSRYGAIGIAMGTLIGAIAGVSWTWAYTLKRAVEFPFSRYEFIVNGAFRPLLCLVPLIAFPAFARYLPSLQLSVVLGLAALIASIALTAKYGRLSPGVTS